MKIREILAKTILSKTSIPGTDYAINPYVGCGHACRYCYAEFIIKKLNKHEEAWGEFVDVKVNAAELLEKEIAKKKRGEIFFSSICDPYQEIEGKYKLTRRCLEIIAKYQFPVSVLTKSTLVLRDIDVFKRIKDCEVGLTITTDDDKIRQIFEPNAPTIGERVNALKKLHNEGISTLAFIGPVLPQNPEILAEMLIGNIDHVLIDRLNYSYKVADVYRKHELKKELSPEYSRYIANTLKKLFRQVKIL